MNKLSELLKYWWDKDTALTAFCFWVGAVVVCTGFCVFMTSHFDPLNW